MNIKQVTDSIYSIGSKDYHRQLFDQLMPLSEGTSYNSYLIKGSEKTALVDTVYPPMASELLEKLKEMGVEKIDYVIANHGEQDHTGTLPLLLELYPEAKIVTNAKCKEITMGFLPLKDEDYIVIEDGQELSLGDKTLQFMFAPWVHWPDTMFAYLKEDGILFSTDFFGSHTTNYDVFLEDEASVIPAAKSYYAEIMMPFAKIFPKYLDKVEALKPKMIASSHGPIYKNPQFIIDLYRKWAGPEKQKKVAIVWLSMYGATESMKNYLKDKLTQADIEVADYDAIGLDVSHLAMDLVDGAGLLIGSPTVLTGPHPGIVLPIYLANAIKPGLKFAGIFGSYSWGTMMVDKIKAMLPNLKETELLEPVLAKGTPKQEDFDAMDKMVEKIKSYF